MNQCSQCTLNRQNWWRADNLSTEGSANGISTADSSVPNHWAWVPKKASWFEVFFVPHVLEAARCASSSGWAPLFHPSGSIEKLNCGYGYWEAAGASQPHCIQLSKYFQIRNTKSDKHCLPSWQIYTWLVITSQWENRKYYDCRYCHGSLYKGAEEFCSLQVETLGVCPTCPNLTLYVWVFALELLGSLHVLSKLIFIVSGGNLKEWGC